MKNKMKWIEVKVLDIEGIRTEVIEAMKDETGEKLKAIRVKYPFLGRRDTKDISYGYGW
jgi:hypothetical protein